MLVIFDDLSVHCSMDWKTAYRNKAIRKDSLVLYSQNFRGLKPLPRGEIFLLPPHDKFPQTMLFDTHTFIEPHIIRVGRSSLFVGCWESGVCVGLRAYFSWSMRPFNQFSINRIVILLGSTSRMDFTERLPTFMSMGMPSVPSLLKSQDPRRVTRNA